VLPWKKVSRLIGGCAAASVYAGTASRGGARSEKVQGKKRERKEGGLEGRVPERGMKTHAD
jgi:hypothetical protein